jgi:hypothetical protein
MKNRAFGVGFGFGCSEETKKEPFNPNAPV